MIQVTEHQIDKVYDLLHGIYNGHAAETALKNAANRAMTTARSQVWKSVKETYTIKQRDFYEGTKIKTFKANQSVIEAGVMFSGYVIPLIKFKTNPAKPVSGKQRKYTKVSVLRDSSELMKHAYIANLGKYGVGVFERLTSKRNSSQQIYGPSVAHMGGNPEVAFEVEIAAQRTFDERLNHEIDRILEGYRGNK